MDAQPRISVIPARLPSLSIASSSGSFPIRAPPTPDDDEASDLDSNFPDSTNSNCSDTYSNSSSYNGFESGEDYEMALQESLSLETNEDGSDQDLFVRPFVAESATDDDIAEESGNVDNNRFFRTFVVDPSDEIVEDDVSIDKNRFFRPFIANPDKEMVEDNVCVDKDRFFRPFVVDPYDQIAYQGKEMMVDNGCVDQDRFFRPFVVVDPDHEIVEEGGGADKNRFCRPFVADLDKETMEESCCVDEDRCFSYAAESDKDSPVAEREDDADSEICSNLFADSNRVISMPIARLSMEFDDEAEFSIIEDIVAAGFVGAAMDGQEKISESSFRTVDGSVLETESCSVSIQQFDQLEMESSEQSAEKDAKEVAFLLEAVTGNAAVDDNTEKSSKPVSDSDEDAKSTETDSHENEIDDLSQLNPTEEHEDLEESLNFSSFFNFMDLNPDLGPIYENPVLDINVLESSHEDDEENELCSSEKTNLENLQLHSAEDPTAASALNLLNLTSNSSAVQQIAIEKNILDFSLNIIVLGKSGVGKSSTINSIFQEQKVETNPFEPSTRTVKEVVGTLKNGIKIRIFDTPGLGQSTNEQGLNCKTLASVKKLMTKFRIDAVLYIDRLDSYDDGYNDLPLLQTISNSLGVSVWQKVLIVFTHASIDPSPLSYREFVKWRHSTIQRCICVVVNPDAIILIENNNNSCEESRDRILLSCWSMKTLNEACSSLGVSEARKWRGDTKVSVDVWSRLSVQRRNRLGSVVRLDVKRGNWKITIEASLICSYVHSLSSV